MRRRSREARRKSRMWRFGRVRPASPDWHSGPPFVPSWAVRGPPAPGMALAQKVRARGCRLFFRQGEGVGAALQDEAKGLVIGRLRAVLRLGIGTVALSILIDLLLDRPGLAALLAFKLAAMVAYGVAAVGLEMLRAAPWPRAIRAAPPSGGIMV